ncbi:MAG: DNA mismatch repair protein MutS, partial [Pyrinomonadaceae bacterium]
REVVKVITPGTAIDAQLLDSREPVYVAAICSSRDTYGLAMLDISNGDFVTTQHSGPNAWTETNETIAGYQPKEFIFPQSLQQLVSDSTSYTSTKLQPSMLEADHNAAHLVSGNATPLDDAFFDPHDSETLLKSHFQVRDLSGFGLDLNTEAIRAAGACLRYALETQRASANHISEIRFLEARDCLVLDAITLRNLEILESRAGERRLTLFGVIDETVTGMGSRLLRSWITRPSIKMSEIQTRLSAVSELIDSILRQKLTHLLKNVADLDRLVGKINLDSATPRDLIGLNRSLKQGPEINAFLSDAKSLLLQVLSENIFALPGIRDLIDRSITDEPPINLADGGTIRDGYC